MSEIPRVAAVVGPTGSGKAALGRELAVRLGLPLLVCDSIKVYRRLDIGSAKPTVRARISVPHHLIDLVDPDAMFTAGDYARAAWPYLSGGCGLFVGGTGLYLRTTLWTGTGLGSEGGMREGPGRGDPRRQAFELRWERAERSDPGATHRALAAVDAATARGIHPNNWVRVVRAFWLCVLAGGPISARRRIDPPRPRARLCLVVLDPGDALRDRLRRRIEHMLTRGWLDEVAALLADGYDTRHKSMQSIGYKQLVGVVRGRTTLEAAKDAIFKATWQLARRQRTYVRHQLPAEHVVHITDPAAMPWDTVTSFVRGAGEKTTRKH